MNLKILGTAFLIFSSSVFAGNRVTLDKAIIDRVEQVQGMESLRVYVNKKFFSIYATDNEVLTDVHSSIDSVISKKILREIVTRRTKGKIIAVENLDNDKTSFDTREEAESSVAAIYVTFEPGCNEKACAYKFSDGEIEYLSGGRRYHWSYYKLNKENRFKLTDIPNKHGYTQKKYSTKRSGKKSYSSITLQVKLNELEKITKESRRLPGVE